MRSAQTCACKQANNVANKEEKNHSKASSEKTGKNAGLYENSNQVIQGKNVARQSIQEASKDQGLKKADFN